MIDKFFNFQTLKKVFKIYFYLSWLEMLFKFKGFKIKSYWDPKKKLGVCADWFVGPRLEVDKLWIYSKKFKINYSKFFNLYSQLPILNRIFLISLNFYDHTKY